jgi:hypothetical protein
LIRLGYLFVALGFRSETRRDHVGRLWLTALSRLVNRRRWPEIFPVTPATILRWHRDLAPASGPAPAGAGQDDRPPVLRSRR